MAQYKVIALSVGGLRNKIYYSGDTVSDECWSPGRAQELVKQGFLKPLDEQEPAAKIDGGPKTIDDYTVKEIKALLDIKRIEYKPNDGKQTLFDKLAE